MTNQQAVNQALMMIMELAAGEDATTTDSADVLRLLNQMMTAWAMDGKNLQFAPQDTLSDSFPVPVWAEEAVIANLAVRAAGLFNAVINPQVADMARNGALLVSKTLLNRDLLPANMDHISRGSAGIFNITTGVVE
jgi:hypothetical protein